MHLEPKYCKLNKLLRSISKTWTSWRRNNKSNSKQIGMKIDTKTKECETCSIVKAKPKQIKKLLDEQVKEQDKLWHWTSVQLQQKHWEVKNVGCWLWISIHQ
jgi:seryl-tRNA synthetase